MRRPRRPVCGGVASSNAGRPVLETSARVNMHAATTMNSIVQLVRCTLTTRSANTAHRNAQIVSPAPRKSPKTPHIDTSTSWEGYRKISRANRKISHGRFKIAGDIWLSGRRSELPPADSHPIFATNPERSSDLHAAKLYRVRPFLCVATGFPRWTAAS